jgi:hypothetical protein
MRILGKRAIPPPHVGGYFFNGLLGVIAALPPAHWCGSPRRMGTLCYGGNAVFLGLRASDFALRVGLPFHSAQTGNALFHDKDGSDVQWFGFVGDR